MSGDSTVRLTLGSAASIEEVAENVGQALGIIFELRDSLYLGGDYYRSRSDRGEVVVQLHDDLGEPAEPTHAELPTLVRIDTTARFEAAIHEALRPLGLIMIDRAARTSR